MYPAYHPTGLSDDNNKKEITYSMNKIKTNFG